MTLADRWRLFSQWWPMSLTMVLGSFVGGATAEGGAAVAFPVFTKALHIPAPDARTFGLMIQSIGMTTASLVIVTRGIKILPGVVGWVTAGGAVGMLIGSFLVPIPPPYPKLLFTVVTAAFGVALILSRWVLKWQPHNHFTVDTPARRLIFLAIGVVGGTFAANTGSGIDTLTFMVLTLAFGINEKVSTPTTVVIMGLNSVVGFFTHGVLLQDIGIVWEYWLVCVPIICLGGPLGAYVARRSTLSLSINPRAATGVPSITRYCRWQDAQWMFGRRFYLTFVGRLGARLTKEKLNMSIYSWGLRCS
ncbi:MAG: sulfite exporter TauE/SafE family protein [Caldilineaceae bacterium]